MLARSTTIAVLICLRNDMNVLQSRAFINDVCLCNMHRYRLLGVKAGGVISRAVVHQTSYVASACVGPTRSSLTSVLSHSPGTCNLTPRFERRSFKGRQSSDKPPLLRGAAAQQAMEGTAQQTMPLAQGQANTQYASNLPAQSDVQQNRSPLQSVGDPAVKPGYSESAGFDAGQGGGQAGFRASRPNTPDMTDTGSRLASKEQDGTAHLTGTADGMKGSWLTQLIGKATHKAQQLSVQLLVGCKHTSAMAAAVFVLPLGHVVPASISACLRPGTEFELNLHLYSLCGWCSACTNVQYTP